MSAVYVPIRTIMQTNPTRNIVRIFLSMRMPSLMQTKMRYGGAGVPRQRRRAMSQLLIYFFNVIRSNVGDIAEVARRDPATIEIVSVAVGTYTRKRQILS